MRRCGKATCNVWQSLSRTGQARDTSVAIGHIAASDHRVESFHTMSRQSPCGPSPYDCRPSLCESEVMSMTWCTHRPIKALLRDAPIEQLIVWPIEQRARARLTITIGARGWNDVLDKSRARVAYRARHDKQRAQQAGAADRMRAAPGAPEQDGAVRQLRRPQAARRGVRLLSAALVPSIAPAGVATGCHIKPAAAWLMWRYGLHNPSDPDGRLQQAL